MSFLSTSSVIQAPRQSAKISYRLFYVLFLTVCATIAGMDGCKAKAYLEKGFQYTTLSPEWYLRLSHCSSKTAWMQAVSTRSNGSLIAIDGKVLRGSYNREYRKSTIHMVSAFATANGIVAGQVKPLKKSNEITDIPELLKLLEIGGCLISIDAMGCQSSIASRIVEQGGDYLLAVKGNQESLAKAVKKALAPVT